MKIKITDFYFRFIGHGHYEVTYTSPKTNKSWTKLIDDMPLIDSTKNAEEPTQIALTILKLKIKQ